MTSSTSPRPTADEPRPAGPLSRRPRGWTVAGLGAAVASVATLVVGSGIDAAYVAGNKNDPARIAEGILDSAGRIAVFHTVTAGSALLLVVFAAGLHRNLAGRTPPASLVPAIASTGLLLTAVVQIMGTGLDTEFSLGARGNITPGALTFYGHWVNTIPWYWAGTGLTALAVAVAALRHRAYGRPTALASLVLGGMTTLLAISPLEYMAAATGTLWLLIFTIGLVLDVRRTPSSEL